jgi:hypothetical protein
MIRIFTLILITAFMGCRPSYNGVGPSGQNAVRKSVTFVDGPDNDRFKYGVMFLLLKNEDNCYSTYRELSIDSLRMIKDSIAAFKNSKSYFGEAFYSPKKYQQLWGKLAGVDHVMRVRFKYSNRVTYKEIENPEKQSTIEWVLGVNKQPQTITVIDKPMPLHKIKLYYVDVNSNKTIWKLKVGGMFSNRKDEILKNIAITKFQNRFPYCKLE